MLTPGRGKPAIERNRSGFLGVVGFPSERIHPLIPRRYSRRSAEGVDPGGQRAPVMGMVVVHAACTGSWPRPS